MDPSEGEPPEASDRLLSLVFPHGTTPPDSATLGASDACVGGRGLHGGEAAWHGEEHEGLGSGDGGGVDEDDVELDMGGRMVRDKRARRALPACLGARLAFRFWLRACEQSGGMGQVGHKNSV